MWFGYTLSEIPLADCSGNGGITYLSKLVFTYVISSAKSGECRKTYLPFALTMFSTISRNTARRTLVATVSCVKNRRAFVQPSGADRASLVDVPSTYQDESHFTPRPGNRCQTFRRSYAYIQSDMLGFKLDVPRREDSMNTKTRPIYLDMQVSLLSLVLNICALSLVFCRLRHPLTLEFLIQCCLILQISMVTLIVGPMLMDGKPSKPWRMLERYHFRR